MAEFVFIFLCIFIVPIVFWVGKIPLDYLPWTFYGIIVLVGIPLLISLPNAPFVPSNKARVDTMLKLAKLNKNKVAYELGCGDSRIIRSAAKKGLKKAVGYDVSLPLIWYGKVLSFFQKNPAKILYGNIWKQDYSDADVVFAYLLPVAMIRVEKEIWPQLKPGALFISNAFPMKGLKEDALEERVYVYVK
jgi:hypothetical protein